MDLYFCPLTFLWFYSQFAILLQMHFEPLFFSQDLSISYWLSCHGISRYIQHKHKISTNSLTKIDTVGKKKFCLPCVPLMTLTSSAAQIWWSTFTEVSLLKPDCLFWHMAGTGIWFLGEERLTTSQSWSEALPAALRGRPVSQSPHLPPLVHTIYLQTRLEVRLRKSIKKRRKKKKEGRIAFCKWYSDDFMEDGGRILLESSIL